MKQNLTITISDKINDELSKIAKDEGLSKSQIVRNAPADYILKRFRRLRSKMMAKAQTQALFTDDDVFEKVS